MKSNGCRGARRRDASASNPSGDGGFSVVELVVTLGIIAVLAALAIVNYLGFRQRALTVEARLGLHNIWLLEKTFQKENNRYSSDFDELEFRMIGTPRYTYTIQADNVSFTARAEANLDGDSALDVWEIYYSDVDPVHLVVD